MEQHPGAFEMLAAEIRKDLVRNAEQRRLAKEAGQPGGPRWLPRFRRSPRPDSTPTPVPAPADLQPANAR